MASVLVKNKLLRANLVEVFVPTIGGAGEIVTRQPLHPGYHGSLFSDVSEGQKETDPIYPESRTRPQLIKSWLPDAFLNPHGYSSHEWVQPFSEYTAWVMNRQGAGPGREWWIPRGWFTILEYLRDPEHP